ncbi:MAG: hypothetical protein Q8O99_00280 [bacterium]|nr:hypothetical protein [bacterium]
MSCAENVSEQPSLPVDRYKEGNTYGDIQITVPETVRPKDPAKDINVMYLNLYGYPRGNDKDVVEYLKNSKTLAITTFRNSSASSTPEEVLTAMIHPDGRYQDRLGNVVSELVTEG